MTIIKRLSTVIALVIIFIYSCKQSSITNNKTNLSFNIDSTTIKLHEGIWYTNFKNEVFIRCLKYIYPQSFRTFIDTTDASSFANHERLRYDSTILKTADSLALNFSKSNQSGWTIENMKVTMNVCMGYRNSIELDSIAVSVYKSITLK